MGIVAFVISGRKKVDERTGGITATVQLHSIMQWYVD